MTVAGPETPNGPTNDQGKITFTGIKTGDYTATATADGYTTETGSSVTVPPASTGKTEVKLKPVTVTIALAAAVACPGHPLEITATGDPGGGTYAWTITGDAGVDLVDAAGATVRTGNKVNLRGFEADPANGNIIAKTSSVSVTYTYTNGSKAKADQSVKIHEIKFAVTNKAITAGFVIANEIAAGVVLGVNGVAEMSTDPKVEIRLDSTCPRKADCAANHRVGWLQTVRTNVRQARYTHSLVDTTVPLPIRDVWNGTVFPFYSTVTAFTGDKDKQTAHHEDSPTQPAGWTDTRTATATVPAPPPPPPPKNLQLRSVNFSNGFTAWLVVQNIEWAGHDVPGSFAYQGNFDWSMELNVVVDISKAVGAASHVTPHQKKATMPATIATGKGAQNPNLDLPIANTANVTAVTAAPEI